ncbi:aldo/keto reductase [Saccharolobus caldissimus]|uniref:Aldo/keto reductase n=1 Tax=Saccharolobus caldissimus TaxID=1702097 RepID=A0AAQ4CS42_9CREN|nr:aldo/keto reductase [Saccharolobus caldissimus]BDB98623.1 aldo/keto reductase [Saccharolobus caldissimus]
MERKTLGWTGEKISPLILGSWEYGTISIIDEANAVKIIRKAIEMGINAIDTAESYGNGLSEIVIGKAIKQFKREEVFIITKVSIDHLRYDDVLRAAEGSLKRLETNYIDLYLVHWPNHYVPIRETAKAMERLFNEGKIRYIGLSNFSLPLLREFREHLSKTDVAANELHYNLLFRDVEKEVLPYMQKENIPLLAYDSLGLGYLVGRKEVRNEYRWYVLAREAYIRSIESLVNEISLIAKELNKTPAQVVLNWLISKDNVFAIFNTTKEEHLKDNLGSIGWKLGDNELRRIDEAVKRVIIDYFVR